MNTSDRNLKTQDLVVGQELTLYSQRRAYGHEYKTVYTTETVTVEKILKNRLVIRHESGRLERLIVEYSPKYTYRNGEVTTDAEGTRARDDRFSYRSVFRILFTKDDPKLVERLAAIDAENHRIEVKNAAQASLDDFKKSLTVENAESAIEALQAWIAAQK
jgi:hypothetical protein